MTSASQIKLWRSCQRAWGYKYLLGMREPEHLWEHWVGMPRGVRGRSAALGKEVHARLESHYRGATGVNWHDEPGRIAARAFSVLPHRDDCLLAVPEAAVVLAVDGVQFEGYRDLYYSRRMLCAADRTELVDYKTTGNLAWRATVTELTADVAANIYAADVLQHNDNTALDCLWLYLQTKAPYVVEPVRFTLRRLPVLQYMSALAAEVTAGPAAVLAARPDVDSLPINTEHCTAYGGCYYHSSNGGPCAAKPAYGAQLRQQQFERTKQEKMTMGFAERRAAQAAQNSGVNSPEANTEPNATPATTAGPEERPAPRAAGRPPKARGAEGSVTISHGDRSADIPPGSPLHARALALLDALFG